MVKTILCTKCGGVLGTVSFPIRGLPPTHMICPTRYECTEHRQFGPEGLEGPQWLDIIRKQGGTPQ